jgi:glycosyltransferase involved in cell wall biosynthesis
MLPWSVWKVPARALLPESFPINLNLCIFAVKVRKIPQTQMANYAFWLCIIPVTGLLVWNLLQVFFILRPIAKVSGTPMLHIVICARNEAERLEKYIPEWMAQDYPSFVLYLADDASDDRTEELSAEWSRRYENFRYIRKAHKSGKGKREILAFALEHVKEGQVVLSDADCRPAGSDFLRRLAAVIGDNPSVYIGLGHYSIEHFWPGSLVQYETLHAGRQYMVGAWLGFPYMGVGRNMGYPVDWGLSALSLSGEPGLVSGDDDLTLQRGRGMKVHPIADAGFTTYSEAPLTWRDWISQKHRHMSTASYYPVAIRFYLGLIWLFMCIVRIGIIGGVVGLFSQTVLALFALSYLFDSVLTILWSLRYDKKNSVMWLPVADFLYTFVIPILWLTRKKAKRNRNRWN